MVSDISWVNGATGPAADVVRVAAGHWTVDFGYDLSSLGHVVTSQSDVALHSFTVTVDGGDSNKLVVKHYDSGGLSDCDFTVLVL